MIRWDLKRVIQDVSLSQNVTNDTPKNNPKKSSAEVQPDAKWTSQPKDSSKWDSQGTEVESSVQEQEKNTTTPEPTVDRPVKQRQLLDTSDSKEMNPEKPGAEPANPPKAQLRSKEVAETEEEMGWGEWLMRKYIASKMSGTTDGANKNKDNRTTADPSTPDVNNPKGTTSSTRDLSIPEGAKAPTEGAPSTDLPYYNIPSPPQIPFSGAMPKFKMPRFK